MSKVGKKRIYKTMYRTSWEKNPMLKDWIQSVPGKQDKAYCKFCQRLLYAHRYSVLKHTCTTKHQQNAQKFRENNLKLYQSCTNSKFSHVEKSENLVDSLHLPSENNIEVIAVNEDNKKHDSDIKVIRPQGIFTFICSEGKDDSCDDVAGEEGDTVDYIEEYAGCNEYHFEEAVEDTAPPTPLEADMASHKALTISTHILDTSRGKAAGNVPVAIFKLESNVWKQVNETFTNEDGRVGALLPNNEFTIGLYKLHFNTSNYFKEKGISKFLYPFVEIVFDCDEISHYHIPLLLNPFGYSTYRGT